MLYNYTIILLYYCELYIDTIMHSVTYTELSNSIVYFGLEPTVQKT